MNKFAGLKAPRKYVRGLRLKGGSLGGLARLKKASKLTKYVGSFSQTPQFIADFSNESNLLQSLLIPLQAANRILTDVVERQLQDSLDSCNMEDYSMDSVDSEEKGLNPSENYMNRVNKLFKMNGTVVVDPDKSRFKPYINKFRRMLEGSIEQ